MTAATLAVVLALAGAGVAIARSSAAGQRASQAVAARQCSTLWAVVNKAGKLQRAGCKGTRSSVVPDGFQVIFPRDVTQCAYVANVGNSGSKGIPAPGIVTVAGAFGHPHGVFVAITDLTGKLIARGFHLIVECR